jgi:hypothetical protein
VFNWLVVVLWCRSAALKSTLICDDYVPFWSRLRYWLIVCCFVVFGFVVLLKLISMSGNPLSLSRRDAELQ